MDSNAQIENLMENTGTVDLNSANAPSYLSGNMRRLEAERARQERKKQRLEQEARFFENLINNLLIPRGLVTDKEREFIFLKDHALRSKRFWELWESNYEQFNNLNGGEILESFVKSEFTQDPVKLLNNKMGSMPDHLFDGHHYLEKLARFAADFQTEWKTPHFSTELNEAGAKILVEEIDSPRNQEAEKIVNRIWELMDDFNRILPRILDYYNNITSQLANLEPENLEEIYGNIFEDLEQALDFEKQRFYLIKKYSRLLFLVKDNWERRLNRKYEGFTDIEDVVGTLDAILERRLEQIISMFSSRADRAKADKADQILTLSWDH